ncbi:hypothetical protein FRC19_000396 [Serendipita sp. 401]|nr:hypothetical protein FRC19_000396 [Serendipita sp. 401]KAG9051720.1 hypothetical protein FS842_011182 [Serendipita sp. 407]
MASRFSTRQQEKKKKVTFDEPQPSVGTAPKKLTKSERVLLRTQDPKRTRQSRVADLDEIALRSIDPYTAMEEAATTEPATPTGGSELEEGVLAGPESKDPASNSSESLSFLEVTLSVEEASHILAGLSPTRKSTPPRPKATLTRENAFVYTGENKLKWVSEDGGLEMWGYPSEEDMVTEESSDGEEETKWDKASYRNSKNDIDNFEDETDPYAERPTFDDEVTQDGNSIDRQPNPGAGLKKTTGKQKGRTSKSAPARMIDDVFNIQIWMKSGASDIKQSIMLQSTDNFVTVRGKVADALRVRDTAVNLAYQFSFIREKDRRSLESDDDWNTFVKSAQEYRRRPYTVRNQCEDAWSAQFFLVDDLPQSSSGGKQKKYQSRSTIGIVRGSTPQSASGDQIKEPALDTLTLAALERLNASLGCAKHGYCYLPTVKGALIIQSFGLQIDHVPVNDTDRTLWAKELVLFKPDSNVTEPSPALLEAIIKNASDRLSEKAKYRQGPVRQGPIRKPPPETPSRYQHSQGPDYTRAPIGNYQNVSNQLSPMAKLSEWLPGLDEMPDRKSSSQTFGAMVPILKGQDIETLKDLIRFKAETLMSIGLTLGTAQKLLDWANEDLGIN